MTPNDILSAAEVAAQLRVPESTLRYWRHRNEGPPCFKIGRRARYRRGDLDLWIEAQFAQTAVGDRLTLARIGKVSA